MFLPSLLRTGRAVYITRIMNRKRKRVEDEEGKEHDDDMGSTASQSSKELTSTEESDFEDDKETEHSLEFKTILKTLSRAVP